MNRAWLALPTAALAVAAAVPAPAAAEAPSSLACTASYGGQDVRVPVAPVDDPYGVPDVEIGSRFRFRAVWVPAPAAEAHLAVSVYQATRRGPVMLQEAKYRPPFPAAAPGAPFGFTGRQAVYEPDLGRELSWWCEEAGTEKGTASAFPTEAEAVPFSAPVPSSSGPTVTIAFAGDVMLDDGPGKAVAAGVDPMAAFADVLGAADLAVANLECPIASKGTPADKPWVFRAHPRAARVVARHFGAVSLANNHSGDQGAAALVETQDRLRAARVPFFGAGRDLAEAHRPLILERNGLRIALLGYDEFFPRAFEATPATPGVAWSGDEQVLRDIRLARAAGADLVIPFLHWGWEGEPDPSPRQRDLARRLIDAGADAVIGGHPHCTQGADVYRGRPIVYSLGNFVFDGFGPGPGRVGWVVTLELSRAGVVRWDTVVARMDARGLPSPDRTVPSPCGRAGDDHPRTCLAGRPVDPAPAPTAPAPTAPAP